MSFASGGHSAIRRGRRYRGSAKRLRQLSSQQNTPVNLLILLLLTMIVPWVNSCTSPAATDSGRLRRLPRIARAAATKTAPAWSMMTVPSRQDLAAFTRQVFANNGLSRVTLHEPSSRSVRQSATASS